MKLSRFPALWFVAVLAMGICISTAQTNGSAPKMFLVPHRVMAFEEVT